jgi:mono/diheme cytochrome c family protein
MRRTVLAFVAGLLTLPAAVALAGLFGWLPTRANVAAPDWERIFARHALEAAAARHAVPQPNPVQATEENLRAGMKLFAGDCAGCHGYAGRGNDTSGGLYPAAPWFAGHPPRIPEYQLFWIVKYGVRYSGMFAWAGQWGKDSTGRDITDQKIWTVVSFIHHLDSLPPAVAVEWKAKGNG